MERISGRRIVAPRTKVAASSKPNLPIDIQAEMHQINSHGFERWAKIFSLKEMAKTVIYLQENGLTGLRKLEKACDAAVQKFNDLSDRTKAASARMKNISELQRHIGDYGKTREIYAQYRKLTDRKQAEFYEQHSKLMRYLLPIRLRNGAVVPYLELFLVQTRYGLKCVRLDGLKTSYILWENPDFAASVRQTVRRMNHNFSASSFPRKEKAPSIFAV